MNCFLRHICLLVIAVLSLNSASAQEDYKLLTDIGFDTFFDNTEYTDTTFGPSATAFAVRFSPQIGLQWNEKNSLMFGVDLFANFGEQDTFASKVRPQIYYRFASPKVRAFAGIFDRKEMRGYYSDLFLSDVSRFYENRVQGFMGQYLGERGYAELSFDWCGMYAHESREKFRVLSAGEYSFDKAKHFYGGYALQVFHYAGSEQISGNVVDNIIVNPYLGARFNAFFDFDIKLHYILTMQRDRAVEEKMQRPQGVMLQARMSKWGLFIEERFYLGDNLMPYYYNSNTQTFPQGYGADLYYGDSVFAAGGELLSDTRIGYSKQFFGNTVSLNAYIAMYYNGGAGTRQMVELKVNLFNGFALGKRR